MLQQVMTAPGSLNSGRFQSLSQRPVRYWSKSCASACAARISMSITVNTRFTKYPVTQGHEVSGEIAALGKGVTSLRVGQRVTIEPQVVCGRCYPCRHGKYNLCEELKVMGFQTTGTASEFFAVDAAKITPLPDTMSFNEGAMIEPLAVAVHAAKRFPELAGAKSGHFGFRPHRYSAGPELQGSGGGPRCSLPISPTPGWSWPGAVGRTSQ